MARAPRLRSQITILDVATAAKLSKSTVSLVLQGGPLIRDKTAARVRQAAAKLGYVYNRRAAELRRKSSNTIGVVINDLMNPFFAEVLVGIERKLVRAGYIVLMAHTSEDLERQRTVLQSMREHNAAGILLCPALGTAKSLPRHIAAWGIPLVVMVRSLGASGYDFAGADYERGIYLASRHLLSASRTRIAFLGGGRGGGLEQRLQGYRAAPAPPGRPVGLRTRVAAPTNP